MKIESIKEKIKNGLREVREFFTAANRNKAVSIIEYEAGELENIFSLLVMGSFIGMPSPPAHISLQLMPLMEREMKIMFNKVGTANDALADIIETLGEP
ncbi:MAG: hypothetical protein PQJ61_08700 [Spirochaetales bacterium]|uniref:Uncharacterized protein n=1 Tax=Candidatus Thalassospirochaeta sargassi TaxID=3119039 RepID=A0AAJ1MJR1_9SPIO|nr:hypothetical protein [Spirochaetales bacterium]